VLGYVSPWTLISVILENPHIFGKIISSTNYNITSTTKAQDDASISTSEGEYLYFVVHDWALASWLVPKMRQRWIVNTITTPEGKKFKCKISRWPYTKVGHGRRPRKSKV